MASHSVDSRERRDLRFERRSEVEWLDFVEHVGSLEGLTTEDVEILSRYVTSGELYRPPALGPMKPLSHDFPFRASRNISALLLDILEEMFSSPYTVNFENGVDVQVQFVWTYELWNGLLRVDQTAYIEPGQTGVVRYARCIDLKQYAFSAWDVDGTAVYKSPTLTVQSINQVEAKWGFYRACTDKIKIAYRP